MAGPPKENPLPSAEAEAMEAELRALKILVVNLSAHVVRLDASSQTTVAPNRTPELSKKKELEAPTANSAQTPEKGTKAISRVKEEPMSSSPQAPRLPSVVPRSPSPVAEERLPSPVMRGPTYEYIDWDHPDNEPIRAKIIELRLQGLGEVAIARKLDQICTFVGPQEKRGWTTPIIQTFLRKVASNINTVGASPSISKQPKSNQDPQCDILWQDELILRDFIVRLHDDQAPLSTIVIVLSEFTPLASPYKWTPALVQTAIDHASQHPSQPSQPSQP